MLEAVIFDMDGLLVDSEPLWFRARRELLSRHGETWSGPDQLAMAGVHTRVWVDTLHERLAGALDRDEILEDNLDRMERFYAAGEVPVLEGAPEALDACAGRYRLGLASGSPRRLIDACLEGMGWDGYFEAVLSSDELERGKPAPDVYVEIMSRMGLEPDLTAVVEDSGAGIQAGRAAGARVVAVPNPTTDPGPEVLALADATLDSLRELEDALERLE